MATRIVRIVVVHCIVCCFAALPSLVRAQQAPPLRHAQAVELPWTIQIGTSLRSVVSELLHKSDTFRHQCARIAAAKYVRIAVVTTPPTHVSTAPRARATIVRYSFGLMRAVIEIPATADHIELIPHEFEHIIEQIEGVDLAAMVRAGDPRAVELQSGEFETTRARAAGLAAADEVRGRTDPTVLGAARSVARMWRGLSVRASGRAARRAPATIGARR